MLGFADILMGIGLTGTAHVCSGNSHVANCILRYILIML